MAVPVFRPAFGVSLDYFLSGKTGDDPAGIDGSQAPCEITNSIRISSELSSLFIGSYARPGLLLFFDACFRFAQQLSSNVMWVVIFICELSPSLCMLAVVNISLVEGNKRLINHYHSCFEGFILNNPNKQ